MQQKSSIRDIEYELILSVFILACLCIFYIIIHWSDNPFSRIDPKVTLILNPEKEIIINSYTWSDLWSFGTNTVWNIGRQIYSIIFIFLRFSFGWEHSRVVFEGIFLFVTGFGMFIFSKGYFFKNNNSYSLLSAILYAFNPFIAIYFDQNITLLLHYLLLPYIGFVIININQINNKNLFLFVFFFSLILSINTNPGTLVIIFFILILILIGEIYQKKNITFKRLLVLALLLFLLSSWSLLPKILYMLTPAAGVSDFSTLERFQALNSQMIEVLRGTNYWEFHHVTQNGLKFFATSEIYSHSIYLIFPILAVSYFVISKPKNVRIYILYIILILGIFLSWGDHPSNPLQKVSAFLEVNSIFEVLRNNFKFAYMLMFSYSLIIPNVISELKNGSFEKYFKVIKIIAAISLVLISIYPFYTPNMHSGYFKAVPKEFYEVRENIDNDTSYSSVLLLPGMHNGQYDWLKLYIDKPIFFALINNKSIIFQETFKPPLYIHELLNIYQYITEYNPRYISEIFNVKYIIVDNTIDFGNTRNLNPILVRNSKNNEPIINWLSNFSDVETLLSTSNVSLFKFNNNMYTPFRVPNIIITAKSPHSSTIINNMDPLDIASTRLFYDKFYYKINYTMFINPEKNDFLLILPNTTLLPMYENALSPYLNSGWNIKNYNIQPVILEYPHEDFGKNIIFTGASNETLIVPFNIDNVSEYKLFIRYFKNEKGGKIKVTIDGEPIEVETTDQINKFIWKEIGIFNLEKGRHELILESVKGFNAVNLLALIPEEDYIKADDEIAEILQNKTAIYLLKAESDLYKAGAKFSNGYRDASNGKVLVFDQNGNAWQDIDILKNGTYRIALRSKGDFEVAIYTKNIRLSSNSLNYTYAPSFDLKKGTYRLEIKPLVQNSILDTVWLYSTESNQTIEELFEVKERSAEVISYEKINPTLWKVKVNATKPFMLSFAEAYDPLWDAKVYKDGIEVEAIKPVSLYSVINGFWVNETGNLDITIRYKPQDWYEMGLAISTFTFIGCIGYIFYEWRRENRDKWALYLKENLEKIRKNKHR